MKTNRIVYKILFVLVLFYCLFGTKIIFADGLIVIPRPHPLPNPFPLEVIYHRVNVEINGQLAVTTIDQAFFNPTEMRLEGFYLFPLPQGAVIKEFKMFIDGKETAAELLDADKARKIYEDIVRQMRDPALLEYGDRGVLKVRIFPIESKSEKKITITYSEILNKDGGIIEYIYPLNTEKFSAKPLKEVSIKIELRSEEEIKTIYCPTHETEIVRKNENNAVLSYEGNNIKPDVDFKLYYNTESSKFSSSLLTYKNKGEDGYFFLSIAPSFSVIRSEVINKDITFVLDVSGSMNGDKLKYAKKALTYCIENLDSHDRFDIIRFSTEAYGLFHKLVDATKENKERADKFINDLKSIGGTNIEEAIQLALSVKNKPDRPCMIVFITDGKPTIGETDENNLVQKIKDANKKNVRIFTFGIGDDLNTHLLDKITEFTKAARSYVSPSEDIEIKISQFYDKVKSPVLTDIKIDFDNVEVYQSYPNNIPDLFLGSNLVIFGRYKGSGNTKIILSGTVDGEKKKFEFDSNFIEEGYKNDFMLPLWASRRIGYLLDLIRLHGENKELVDEVTDLARKYGIITPYTSYLILEDEETRLARRELPETYQTLNGAPSLSADVKKQVELEYRSIMEKSGAYSVQSSTEISDLGQADNLAQTQQGSDRLNYRTEENNINNLTQQVKLVNGRAFYRNGDFWVDSDLQTQLKGKVIKIEFGSEDYFNLFYTHPEFAQFLALGQNVRFISDKYLYEVYE